MSSVVGILKGALLTIVSVLGSFILLEIGIRLYSMLFFPKMMVLDDALGWRHASEVRKTFVNEFGEEVLVVQNRFGHRGQDYPLQKESSKTRVLVLGDSFTEGVQVGEGDLFTAQLEKDNPHLEVINAGVGGYGTVQEYLYLAAEGIHSRPDLVLVMVYENDLTDNCLSFYAGFGPRPYAFMKDGRMNLVREPEYQGFNKYLLPISFAGFLNRHSYLFYFLNSNVYHQLFAERMQTLQKEDLRSTDGCEKKEVFDSTIAMMKELLVHSHVSLALVFIPSRETVGGAKGGPLEGMQDICHLRSLRCLSLLDRFRQDYASHRPGYFPVDIHWTKAGHRLAAEEIGRFLRAIIEETSVGIGRRFQVPSATGE